MSEAEKALFDGLIGGVLHEMGREVPEDAEGLRRAFQEAVERHPVPVVVSLDYLAEAAHDS